MICYKDSVPCGTLIENNILSYIYFLWVFILRFDIFWSLIYIFITFL